MAGDEQAEFALAILKLVEENLEPEEYNQLVTLLLEKQYRQYVRHLIPNIRDSRMIAVVCTEICRRSMIQPSEFKAMPKAEKIQTIEHLLQIGPLESQETAMGQKPQGAQPGDDVIHSDDFRSVNWFGESFQFTMMQAACVKVLWENWQRGISAEHQLTILEKAGSAGERLRDVFAKGKHSAWGALIVPGNAQGTYRLEPRKKPTTPH